VLLYPPGTPAPNGSYADHLGIVTAAHSDGTVNPVNGDFLGASNISAQCNTNVHLSTWASQVEGNKGEERALVSPLLEANPGALAALSPSRPGCTDHPVIALRDMEVKQGRAQSRRSAPSSASPNALGGGRPIGSLWASAHSAAVAGPP
jgi:hypothetical protein